MAEQIISKICRICKQTKPLSQFSQDNTHKDRHMNQCKTCFYLKYIKKYNSTEKGKANSRRYKRSEKGKANNKRYRQGEKGKVARKRYALKNNKQEKARHIVESAIRKGELPRPDSLQCSCGESAKHYHHHKGYEPEHWLDVIPVCIKCHNT